MADQDNFDLGALASQMNDLADSGDQAAANQLLASLASSSSGAPQLAPPPQSPLQGKVAAANAIQNAPQIQPDLNNNPTSASLPPAIANTIAAMSSSGPASSPMVQGGLTPERAALRASQPLKPTPSGLPGLIMDMINPNRNVAPGQYAPSKLDHFNDFLSNFLGALSKGFESEGRGPGSNLRGLGAAIQAPYQQALERLQLQQQMNANQAQIAGENARTAQTQAQTAGIPAEISSKINAATQQLRFDPQTKQPIGIMNDAQYQQYLKGQGAATVNAAAKVQTEQFKTDLESGKVARLVPAVDPSDGQAKMLKLDAKGNPIGYVDNSIVAGSNTKFTQNSDGSYSTVTTMPNVPTSSKQAVRNIRQGKGPRGTNSAPITNPALNSGVPSATSNSSSLPPQINAARAASMEKSTDQITSQAVQLVNGDLTPDELEGKTKSQVLNAANQYSLAKFGHTYNSITGGGTDSFGNKVGVTSTGTVYSKPEYIAAQKTFNKDYIEPINKLAKTQSEFESIRDDPNQTGAQKVTALLAAVGISGDALKGNGFRISQQVIDEHANARNVWQTFAQKWNTVAGSGGPITSKQIADYTAIAQGVVHDSFVQAAREAMRQGLPVDFLPKANSQGQKADDGILRIYVDSANGDVNKAHKALKAAGWN